MTFLVRRSGVFYYRKTFVTPDGKRQEFKRSLKTSDPKLAQLLALKLYFKEFENKEVVGVIRQQSTGEALYTVTKPLPPALTVSKAISQFLAEKARTGHWTEREYRRGANMLEELEGLVGACAVTSIGKREASSFRDELLKSKRSVTTINNYMKRAAMLWDWLHDRGDASSNPFRGSTVKQRRQIATLRDAWSPQEKEAFLTFAHKQEEWRKWVLLILRYTGARPNEICQLYRDDVRL